MKNSSRREFLKSSGSMLSGTWLAMRWPALLAAGQAACTARNSAAAFENLTGEEAGDLEAIAAQIIPTDDTPGAREAGVIYFMDKAFGTFMAGAIGSIRQGLDELNAEVATQHPDIARFANLEFSAQTELLRTRDSTPFFQTVLFLTRAGMFTMPDYGGNRDHIGWQLLGFNHQHVWHAPYGYYDAEEHNGENDHDRV